MSKTQYYIQQGQVITKTTGTTKGLFSLSKFFKLMADRFHIPYLDDCCETIVDNDTNLPIRYNADAAKLQYYNPDDKVWVNLTTF